MSLPTHPSESTRRLNPGLFPPTAAKSATVAPLGAQNAPKCVETGNAGQWLTLPYPPSANNYWRSIVINGSVRVLVSTQARKYKAAVQSLAGTHTLLTGPIGIRIRIYRPKRIGDLGNRIKVLEDALQGVLFAN